MAGVWKTLLALGRRGSSAIEYAIIFPVLLLVMLGIMDSGRLLWAYSTLYRATEAAARCGAVDVTACGTTNQIRSKAVSSAWGLTVAPAAFTVATPACGVQVSASYSFSFSMPGFSPLALNASSCHPK